MDGPCAETGEDHAVMFSCFVPTNSESKRRQSNHKLFSGMVRCEVPIDAKDDLPSAVSVLCAIFRQNTHLNFKDLLGLFALRIQYFPLTFAAVFPTLLYYIPQLVPEE